MLLPRFSTIFTIFYSLPRRIVLMLLVYTLNLTIFTLILWICRWSSIKQNYSTWILITRIWKRSGRLMAGLLIQPRWRRAGTISIVREGNCSLDLRYYILIGMPSLRSITLNY